MAGMEIASLFAKVSADTGDFSRGMDKVKRDLGDAESGMGKFGNMIGNGLKLAAGVGVAAVGAVATGIGFAVNQAAEFEQGIADIGAMMNLTAEDTATLQAHIMDLGLDPGLKVSADEAAGAVMSLGTAGLSMTQIMEGASKATVLLANATGLKGKEGFAKAASIATDVMAQFKIEAKDLNKAVSKIAGTTIASKFSIDDYALAIAQAGGVAGAVGVEFDDFNATIAAISPSFASGSDAGTSLKTFLQRMIPTTKDAIGKFKELGLITTDWARMSEYLSDVLGYEVEPNVTAVYKAFQQTAFGAEAAAHGQEALGEAFQTLSVQFEENAFFDDVTHEMKGMDEVAGLLQTAFADLTDEQKIEAATTLFGTDAMRAAFGVMDAGKEGIQEYKAAIGDVDAEELAAKRMDTVTGKWEIFRGVVDTLVLQLGTAFLPVAEKVVGWATDLAQTYGPGVITWFEGVATSISNMAEGDFEGTIFEDIALQLADLRKKWDEDWAGMHTTLTTFQTNVLKENAAFWVEWNKTFHGGTQTTKTDWESFWQHVTESGAESWLLIVNTATQYLRMWRTGWDAQNALMRGDFTAFWESMGEVVDSAANILLNFIQYVFGVDLRNAFAQVLLNVWNVMVDWGEKVENYWNNSFGAIPGVPDLEFGGNPNSFAPSLIPGNSGNTTKTTTNTFSMTFTGPVTEENARSAAHTIRRELLMRGE